jgi:hypothetical protein
MSNRSQWSAYDRGSCTEEPRDRETVTRGSEVAVGVERPLPTITMGRNMQRVSVGECGVIGMGLRVIPV